MTMTDKQLFFFTKTSTFQLFTEFLHANMKSTISETNRSGVVIVTLDSFIALNPSRRCENQLSETGVGINYFK